MGIPSDQIQIKCLWSELLESLVLGAGGLSERALAATVCRFLGKSPSDQVIIVAACDDALHHYTKAHQIFTEIVAFHAETRREAGSDAAVDEDEHLHKQILRRLEVNTEAFTVLREHLQDHTKEVTPNARRALLSVGLNLDQAWEHLISAHGHLTTCGGVGDIKAAVAGKRGGRPEAKETEPDQTFSPVGRESSSLSNELEK
jgi:hypothetical protein